jgi:hypothetical protein
LLPVPTFAQLYVAPGGSDANPGTQSAPLATITKASTLVRPGGTVFVAPGLYNEAVVTAASGTATQRIQYVSQVNHGAIIWPLIANGSSTGYLVWKNTGDYSDITGFQIAGKRCDGIGLAGSYQGAYDNEVYNSADGCKEIGAGSGINSENYSAGHNTIRSNYVHDVGRGNTDCGPGRNNVIHGIYISNVYDDVEYNRVDHSCAYNIHLWHAASHATISHNTSVRAGDSGILVGSGNNPCSTPPGCPGNDYTVVSYNIVAENTRAGIYEYCDTGGTCGSHNTYVSNISYKEGITDWALGGKVCTSCVVGVDPFLYGAQQLLNPPRQ